MNESEGSGQGGTSEERAEELLQFALHLARGAGEKLRAGFGTVARGEVGYKGWRNLVTEFDLAVEQWIVGEIGLAYPDHGVLAEERGLGKVDPAHHLWIIDPLDGTTNYVHHHPMYCVSIALEDEAGLLVGVVYAPSLDELFAARRGGGATMNGSRMRVSEESDLGHALLASGFAYKQGEEVNNNLDNWSRLSLVCRGLRRCGAAALDLAYVADGRYEGFWELFLSPWDVAAGALLVKEAGGRVTDGRGTDDWLHGSSVVASNGLLHDSLLGHLSID